MPTKNRQPDISGIHELLSIKRMRNEATFRICCDGSSYYIFNGHKLTENQFNEMLPTELIRHNVKGKRIGSTQQIF